MCRVWPTVAADGVLPPVLQPKDMLYILCTVISHFGSPFEVSLGHWAHVTYECIPFAPEEGVPVNPQPRNMPVTRVWAFFTHLMTDSICSIVFFGNYMLCHSMILCWPPAD